MEHEQEQTHRAEAMREYWRTLIFAPFISGGGFLAAWILWGIGDKIDAWMSPLHWAAKFPLALLTLLVLAVPYVLAPIAIFAGPMLPILASQKLSLGPTIDAVDRRFTERAAGTIAYTEALVIWAGIIYMAL